MENSSDRSSSDIEKTLNSVDVTAGGTPDEPPPRDIQGWKWIAVVLAILSSTFLFALDNTITANIQADIVRDFEAVNKLSWISVGLVMSASATVLLWGKIFFQFNTKWTYIISVAIFEVGSAVCGSAPSMDALIVGRVLCGIGGSGLYCGVITLLAATTTLQERPMYVASTGMTWGLGMVLGPIVGGGFSQSSVGWRWAFYINLLIGAACAPVYLFLIPNIDPRKGAPLAARIREIDWLGSILNLGAFLSGVMAISFGGLTWAWGSGNIIGLFVCSGVLFILLGLQQAFTIGTTVTRRIVPVEFFRSRTMLILFACTSAAGTACFVPVYFVPLFFQFTRGDGALDAGVRLLPFIIPCIFMICVNGGVMSAYGLYMPWYTIGGALVLTGGALFYTVGVDTSAAHIYGYGILTGFGTGMYLQASFSVAQASVSLDMVASASGFITCAQVVGTTIALAIANSVFLNESQRSITHLLPNISIQEVEAVIAGTSTLVSSLPAVEKVKVESAIVDAMSTTYILVIVAGALTLLLGLSMKRERLFLQPAAAA
ncbi:MFS drug efflux transporter [Penicillium frequentans]|uniref:MFS drug efflux transporter n=1 Tax=Penicillium frequentans TaxID=3151616 RepID=A0AAD6CKY2_9EURO|nr:MFS drug efflux transporter [Penicillium glabrum]KAJ5537369.1 MFS drug efflux transporter [Penicillium glabrum]